MLQLRASYLKTQMGWKVLRISMMLVLTLGIALPYQFDLAGTPTRAQANLQGDPDKGKTKAALCSACHGVNGISVNPLWPSLAGQQEQYLVNQIKAFRDGEREEITMQPFVANLTDQDVADLAAYYAALSPCP